MFRIRGTKLTEAILILFPLFLFRVALSTTVEPRLDELVIQHRAHCLHKFLLVKLQNS